MGDKTDSSSPSSPCPEDLSHGQRLSSSELEEDEDEGRPCDEVDEAPPRCPLCSETTEDRHSLTLHIRKRHQPPDPEGSVCQICRKSLGSPASLDRHVLVHSGERPYTCDVCGLSFTTNGNMNRHLRSHDDASSPTKRRRLEDNNNIEGFDLETKDKFLARLELRKSPETEEEQDCFTAELRAMKLRGEFPCRLCRAVFPNLRALKGHNRVHLSSGSGNFQCNLCPYFSSDKASVVRHMRSHNGERPYTCRLCNFAFTSKANCERHLRNRHPEVAETKNYIQYTPESDVSPAPPDDAPLDLTKKKPPPVFTPVFNLPFSGYLIPPHFLFPNLRKELLNLAPPSPPPVEPTKPVKMVIKNGVLVPKQKQRRYRTERPFSCDHCTAKFTLRSNMERHVKQQHPQFWSARVKSRKRSGSDTPDPKRIPEGVKTALVEKLQDRKDVDLASVSKLLDNASTTNFKQFFGQDQNHDGSEEEEGLVASNSDQSGQSGDDSAKSENGTPPVAGKKKSAYSLAPNRVSCPYCFRKFPWSSSLRRHILTHTGQKPFKCPHCPLLFTTKSNCDRHLVRKHGGGGAAVPQGKAEPDLGERSVPDRPYKCRHCPASTFSTQSNLRKHMASRHEAEGSDTQSSTDEALEMPFKCHLCEGSFPERQEVLDHLKEKHNPEYTSLVNKGALESSCEEVEDNEEADPKGKFPDYANRKVICAFCLRRFWSAEDLRRHMRTHTGERPFSCDICTRRFTLKHSMLRHKKKHAGADSASSAPTTAVTPSPGAPLVPKVEPDSDLITDLLGLKDKSMVDKMLESADSAAKLLGVKGE